MADLARFLFSGFMERIPTDAPRSARTAFVLWRVTAVLLPLFLLALGGTITTMGEQMVRQAEAIMNDPLLIVFTLGLAALFALIIMAIGTAVVFFGIALFVLAPVAFVLLSRSLGAVLRGDSSSVTGPAITMGVAAGALLLVGSLPAGIIADVVGASVLAMPLVFVAVVAPAAGLVFLLVPETREWVAARAPAEPAPKGWTVVRG